MTKVTHCYSQNQSCSDVSCVQGQLLLPPGASQPQSSRSLWLTTVGYLGLPVTDVKRKGEIEQIKVEMEGSSDFRLFLNTRPPVFRGAG